MRPLAVLFVALCLFVPDGSSSRLSAQVGSSSAQAWRQAGGPDRDFIIRNSPKLAESWPAGGPPTLWSRPLGAGHSAILVEDGRLYTMYRPLGVNGARPPWLAEEAVIALDARSGQTLWEYKYASKPEDFSQGAGPHSTPLIVGDRLFTFGTNKQLHAFDKRTGKIVWSHDLVKEFAAPVLSIRPVVKAGYGCSPIAYKDTIICFVGGPGQAVVAFRQSDGSVAWKSGHFLISDAPPVLIRVDGQEQLIIFAGAAIHGLNPDTGAVLWSHVHDPGNDFNFSPPLWGPDNILFMSSAYKMGSRAISLKRQGDVTIPQELWYLERIKFQFLNALRLGDFVYGTSGSVGVAFLTALNVKTGQIAWQHRGFAQSTLLAADGKVFVLDEDGDLAITRFNTDGVTVLSEARIFNTRSWTVPSLVGSTLYARDREKVVALDVAAR
jgi:outer membrane protein assembly factor BamB